MSDDCDFETDESWWFEKVENLQLQLAEARAALLRADGVLALAVMGKLSNAAIADDYGAWMEEHAASLKAAREQS